MAPCDLPAPVVAPLAPLPVAALAATAPLSVVAPTAVAPPPAISLPPAVLALPLLVRVLTKRIHCSGYTSWDSVAPLDSLDSYDSYTLPDASASVFSAARDCASVHDESCAAACNPAQHCPGSAAGAYAPADGNDDDNSPADCGHRSDTLPDWHRRPAAEWAPRCDAFVVACAAPAPAAPNAVGPCDRPPFRPPPGAVVRYAESICRGCRAPDVGSRGTAIGRAAAAR